MRPSACSAVDGSSATPTKPGRSTFPTTPVRVVIRPEVRPILPTGLRASFPKARLAALMQTEHSSWPHEEPANGAELSFRATKLERLPPRRDSRERRVLRPERTQLGAVVQMRGKRWCMRQHP